MSWEGDDYITDDEGEILMLCLWDVYRNVTDVDRLELSAAVRRHLADPNEPNPVDPLLARAWEQAVKFR